MKPKPFYWNAPPQELYPGWSIAPSGWYLNTEEGLKYLGESILELTGGQRG